MRSFTNPAPTDQAPCTGDEWSKLSGTHPDDNPVTGNPILLPPDNSGTHVGKCSGFAIGIEKTILWSCYLLKRLTASQGGRAPCIELREPTWL